jgi:uncharacterized protein
MILYLHGFRSSPASAKSQMMARYMAARGRQQELISPQLPPSPKEAIALCESLIAGVAAEDLSVIGSSLGGYYTRFLAEKFGCRGVAINPALRAWEKLEGQTGAQTFYHDQTEHFVFTYTHLEELRALDVARITRPKRYMLLAATGYELLDYREMVVGFPGAHVRVVQGSDHGMGDFESYIDEVLAFCDAKESR